MKVICLLIISLLSTTLVSYANMEMNHWTLDRAFYECLHTCTDYDSTMEIMYNNGNNTETYWRTISKENGKCVVTFNQTASSKNPPANAGGVGDVYQFPMRILKKINENNFYKYAQKYYDAEHSH